MFIVLKTLFLAIFLAVIFTHLMRLLALRLKFVDMPGERKIHQYPMPLMGGWAIYISLSSVLWINKLLFTGSIPYLLIVGLMLLLVGTFDERGLLHSQIKLFIAMPVAGLIMALVGVKFDIFYPLFNKSLLDILFTVFWFTGFIASFGIIDHMDGLNSGLSLIAALFFAGLFFLHHNLFMTYVSLIYAGSVLGFCFFNFHPAKIFLGDGGAMLNGFMMGFLSINLSRQIGHPLIKIIFPLFILIVPCLDTSLCILSRSRRKLIPFASPGKDHIAHRLMNLGLSQRTVVIMLYSIAVLGGLIALFSPALSSNFIFIILVTCLFLYIVFILWMENLPFIRQTKNEFREKI